MIDNVLHATISSAVLLVGGFSVSEMYLEQLLKLF